MKNNWPVKKLGEVATYINGRAFKQEEWATVGIPIIRIQNLTGTQDQFNYFNGKLEERYLINRGDILLSWSASLGVYIWDKEKAALNQHIFKVIPNVDEVNKDFLFYLLQTKVEEMKSKVHGGTMKHITKDVFEKIQIALPSLNDQKKIVEKLDTIRKAQELIDLQKQLYKELYVSVLSKSMKGEMD
ncbi:MAG: hypothetical protein A2046_02625 [Bacteroidetes bacterium GWA2_30_7]|nr:MAG: hypothetical protein A2046_02625 [Bacteroidetes bacterium GWA2_30_7]